MKKKIKCFHIFREWCVNCEDWQNDIGCRSHQKPIMKQYTVTCDICKREYKQEANKEKILKKSPDFKTYCGTKCFLIALRKK